jgi:hypothetical protein
MKRVLKRHVYPSALLVFVLFAFAGCHHNGPAPAPALPPLLAYNTYNQGAGTNYNQGALEFDINSSYSYYASYQYYEVNIFGLGVYELPQGSNVVTLPYLWPGSYSFSVHVGCLNGYNTGCYDQYINGTANVYYATTTQVIVSPR